MDFTAHNTAHLATVPESSSPLVLGVASCGFIIFYDMAWGEMHAFSTTNKSRVFVIVFTYTHANFDKTERIV